LAYRQKYISSKNTRQKLTIDAALPAGGLDRNAAGPGKKLIK
jgi:hypothetical protein